MRLTGIEIRTTADHVRLIGHVSRELNHKIVPWAINESQFVASGNNTTEAEVYFEFPKRYESFVSHNADAFAIALLLPSMAAGEPLEIVPPVSELLLFNLRSVQEIFHTWYPKFESIPICAKPRIDLPQSLTATTGAATFFSGGVDSFYTLLKRFNQDRLPAPLTHIIFMHGVEQRLADSNGTDLSQRRAEQIAATIGIECIVGRTNLRTLFPLHWERYYFGSVLGATALALSKGFGYVCIPSSFTYHHQVPHGSSPLVDDRFSTETVRVVHDGGEASRAEKTAKILAWNQPIVLENLRVCIENSGGDFNCGKCYKCVRTAVALKAVGLWEMAMTFPDKATSHWSRVIFEDHPVLTLENLELARERGIDRELVIQLEHIVSKLNRYEGLSIYVKNSPLKHLLPVYRQIRRWAGATPRMH